MSETNEHALRAVDEYTGWFDPFAERPFVPVPKGCWRGPGDLGRYFRSLTPTGGTALALIEHGRTVGRRFISIDTARGPDESCAALFRRDDDGALVFEGLAALAGQ